MCSIKLTNYEMDERKLKRFVECGPTTILMGSEEDVWEEISQFIKDSEVEIYSDLWEFNNWQEFVLLMGRGSDFLQYFKKLIAERPEIKTYMLKFKKLHPLEITD